MLSPKEAACRHWEEPYRILLLKLRQGQFIVCSECGFRIAVIHDITTGEIIVSLQTLDQQRAFDA